MSPRTSECLLEGSSVAPGGLSPSSLVLATRFGDRQPHMMTNLRVVHNRRADGLWWVALAVSSIESEQCHASDVDAHVTLFYVTCDDTSIDRAVQALPATLAQSISRRGFADCVDLKSRSVNNFLTSPQRHQAGQVWIESAPKAEVLDV